MCLLVHVNRCVCLYVHLYIDLKLNCEKLQEGSMILNDGPLKQQMELNVDTCDIFCMGRYKNSWFIFAVMPEIPTNEEILVLQSDLKNHSSPMLSCCKPQVRCQELLEKQENKALRGCINSWWNFFLSSWILCVPPVPLFLLQKYKLGTAER